MTINEPWGYTFSGHDLGIFPPCLIEPESVYSVIHNLILAHAKTYRLYEAKFKGKQKGKIGIRLDCFGLEPASNSKEDEEATQVAFEFRFGLIASPLLFGKYPDCVQEKVAKKSQSEGRSYSRLPIITREISQLIQGTLDFIGLNHYTCEKVSATLEGIPEGQTRIVFSSSSKLGFYGDPDTCHFHDPTWPGSGLWWLKVTPPALRSLLNRIKNTYNNIEILISENGFPDKVERLEDNDRANAVSGYLNETLKAIKLDGCNVTGYYAWGFLDGWEFTTGHDVTFGLFHVNRNHPTKQRTARYSAKILKSIYENHGFRNWSLAKPSFV